MIASWLSHFFDMEQISYWNSIKIYSRAIVTIQYHIGKMSVLNCRIVFVFSFGCNQYKNSSLYKQRIPHFGLET